MLTEAPFQPAHSPSHAGSERSKRFPPPASKASNLQRDPRGSGRQSGAASSGPHQSQSESAWREGAPATTLDARLGKLALPLTKPLPFSTTTGVPSGNEAAIAATNPRPPTFPKPERGQRPPTTPAPNPGKFFAQGVPTTMGTRPDSTRQRVHETGPRTSKMTLTGQVSNWVLEAADVDFLWLRGLERRSGPSVGAQ